MKIYIMRHAETELNKKRLLQGQQDFPLSEAGRQQALETGRKLKEQGFSFQKVYCSPLCRASQTASLVTGFNEEEMTADERLIELDYGPFEGKGYAELDGSMFAFFEDPLNNPPPEGIEGVEKLIDRVTDFLKELETRAGASASDPDNPAAGSGDSSPEEGDILIVTHGVAIRAMMTYLRNMTGKEIWHLMINNCEMFVTELTDSGYSYPVRYRDEDPVGK